MSGAASKPRTAGLLLVGALCCVLPTGTWAQACRRAEVVRVHDGDTLTLRCDGKPLTLRLAGIDAPEYRQPGGREARAALAALIDGRPLAVAVTASDRYGRRIGDISIDGNEVSLSLVAQGWAWCGARSAAACRSRQESARRARRGLWREPDPLPPWRWRELHPYRR
ncbi:thermonuclease family protein [Sinimarinibacterium thermocellulolyticum]|uniref:Thermonuclease family protein n=1 Tax=Sinimarinibacterium thermocellulolyticum TaxID=3170016 RepID=A0ABV2AAZ2_9GAMM